MNTRRFPLPRAGAAWLRRSLCALVLLFGSGCSLRYEHTVVDYPTLELVAVGTPTLNTDETGQANSVALRVYELADTTDFQLASVAAFWENDDRVLRDALISRQVIILQPGAEQKLRLQLRPDTRYVGVAANFARPQVGGWRQLYPLAARRKAIRVVVHADHLTLERR